jgi:hypothetical protein
MRMIAGRVQQGRVLLDEPLPEGTDVAVAVPGTEEETVEVEEALVRELEQRIADVERNGRLVPLSEVLASMRRR